MELVKRTLKVLTILSKEKDGISVSALAAKMDIPASSAHRVLTCLKEEQFVSQDDETKKYRIGYKVLTLGSNITQESSLVHTARPMLNQLAEETGKTIALCIMEGSNVVCVDCRESKDTMIFLVRTGFAMPSHTTSAGKVMLAFTDRAYVRHFFETVQPEVVTQHSITDPAAFYRELDRIKEQGYAMSDEELQLGVQGVACPIFDFNRKVTAAVAFTVLKTENYITHESIGLLKSCARQISRSLGYPEG